MVGYCMDRKLWQREALWIISSILLFGECLGFVGVSNRINLERSLKVQVDTNPSVDLSDFTWLGNTGSSGQAPPNFLLSTFMISSPSTVTSLNECDDVNRPPSLNILLRTLQQLTRGGSSTDIRGRFVDHKRLGSLASVAHEIGRQPTDPHSLLTPFAAYCLGNAFARFVIDRNSNLDQPVTIVVGQDPRPHGARLADAFCRGAESIPGVQVFYSGITTTPACAAFCRLHGVDASVMVTASHLPLTRNGFKMFYRGNCLTLQEIAFLGNYASQCAVEWYTKGAVPPSSGEGGVMCSQWVDYMPTYADSLKQAILRQVFGVGDGDYRDKEQLALQQLSIVVNAGHGSGGFFVNVLKELGAKVDGSIGVMPDSTFPLGIPNPEYKPMIDETIRACQQAKPDLGIMLDTDSDRCGFVVPADDTKIHYEPLNRNRLIALMGVILAREHPNGCAVVTDSVTSEGLTTFLQDKLGLAHVRYIKGYQNVIDKAKQLTETGSMNVELAMETSGHGAMRENYYLDDGTYTAVKVVSLLAQERQRGNSASPLDLIADLVELEVTREIRFNVVDNTLEAMREVFDFCALQLEEHLFSSSDTPEEHATFSAPSSWSLDVDNLEGIRVRVGEGQFFMLRKSLHDPIISLQLEAKNHQAAKELIVRPLLQLFESEEQIRSRLDLTVLRDF